MRKAQIGLEFMTGVAILLFIYAVVVGIFGSYIQAPMITNERGKQVCYSVARAIDIALIGGEGFSANTTIPYKIDHNNYFVIVSDNSLITVDWIDGITSCSLATQNVSTMFLYPCTFSTNKMGDSVIISGVMTEKSEYVLGETIYIWGGYFINDVNFKIESETGTIVDTNLSLTDSFFDYVWIPSTEGKYILYAQDTIYKTLNSKKEINIL